MSPYFQYKILDKNPHFKMVGSNHKMLICTHKMLAKLDTKNEDMNKDKWNIAISKAIERDEINVK